MSWMMALGLTAWVSTQQGRLPGGSDLSIDEASRRAHIIAVAEIVKPGVIMGSRGVLSYLDVELNPVEPIKGGAEAQELRKVSFRVRERDQEVAPEMGEKYIFFVEKHEGKNRAIMVLRPTQDNLKAAGKCGVDRLPGNAMKTEEAARRAKVIVVAEIVSLGVGDGSRGVMSFPQVTVKPLGTLKGEAEGRELRTVSVDVREEDEMTPRAGEKYIFFVEKAEKDRVIKLLKAAEENSKAVGSRAEP